MTLGKAINDNCYIALVDHIYTACERVKEGIFVKNALLWDIKRFYKIEYEVGKRSLRIIKESSSFANGW